MDDVPSEQPTSGRGRSGDEEPGAVAKPDAGSQPAVTEDLTATAAASAAGTPAHRNQPPSRPEYHSGSRSFSSHSNYAGRPPAMNMADLNASLPTYQAHGMPYDQQRGTHQQYLPGAQSQGTMYPMAPYSPYGVQSSPGTTTYGVQYPQAYPAYAARQQQHQPQPPPLQHGTPVYPPYLQNPSAYQASPLGQTPIYRQPYYPQQSYIPATGHDQPPPASPIHGQSGVGYYVPQSSSINSPSGPRQDEERRSSSAPYDVTRTIVDGSNPARSLRTHSQPYGAEASARTQSHAGTNTLRGPPRKPKQSGHALWVGNLPPGVSVVDLKDHFSRDAKDDIESVFLISKSNCAFVNYKTDKACTAALTRFHDSRFHGVRLVCRLRRGLTMPGSNINPTAPPPPPPLPVETEPAAAPTAEGSEKDTPEQGERARTRRPDAARARDRYFVVKSLTVEDLELSKQSGLWATQTHNEATLNSAYETTENVYLIFSANKSGEYFGYARMISPISEDDTLALEMPPRPELVGDDSEQFRITHTDASATAPKGRIIDDSARGTIFWEADSSEDEEGDDTQDAEPVGDSAAAAAGGATAADETSVSGQSFGKPFRIEWLSTERVPFYRTRGLRNPWNANREVKIARDGTEIEPSVGRKVIQLFHAQSSGESSAAGGQSTAYSPAPQPY